MFKNISELEVSKEFLNDVEIAFNKLVTVAKDNRPDFNGTLSPEDLDFIYPILKKGTRWNKKKRNISIFILGAGLGKLMVDNLGFKWIMFRDNAGTEFAIKNDDSNWTAFPFSSIQKRIRTSEKNFFSSIYESFKSDIKETHSYNS